jgi:uncharacterized protein
MIMAARRTLPALTPTNHFFWTGGASGQLAILHCADCGHWLHPPGSLCPECLGTRLEPRAVSGLGVVEACTVNHHAWSPDLAVPYVIAIVSLVDCPQVRLTTNIVGIAPDAVRIGMSVRCTFEQHEDVWLPLFTPA